MQKYTFLRDSRHNHRLLQPGKCAHGIFRTVCRSLHSSAFYFADYTTNNGDWTWPQNTDLWRDEVKTLFDPCPAGWRVPRGGKGELSPWQHFSSTKANNGQPNISGDFVNGCNFYRYPQNESTCWYPALGRFNGNTAIREQIGKVGYYWTSSDVTGTISSYHLYFTAFTIYPSNDDYHSHAFGLSVRCVRE